MEANMKDMIARLATHQTTPISTCNRNDHDEDTFYEDNLDDYDGSYDDDDDNTIPIFVSFFLLVSPRAAMW